MKKILREMYRDKFILAGFDIIWAHSAEERIKVVDEIKPDLILLDILLSEANGVSFLKWLKEKELSSIPVIAFSNYDGSAIKKRGI